MTDRGLAHTMSGQYEAALADFDAAIRLRPGFADAYLGRGNVHLEQRDFSRAIADFDEAIRDNPSEAAAYADRERAVRLKSKYGDSAANNDQAKLDLEKAGDLRLRADRLWQKHLYQDAIEQYDEVVRLDPAIAEVYYRRGYAYAMREKHDRAIADYDLAIELDPRNVVAYLDRAESLMHSGLYDRAAADLDVVVRHDPLPEVLRLRGLARFWSERYDEAARDLQKGLARDLMSEDDLLWLYLARLISGGDGMAELRANAGRLDRRLAALWLGEPARPRDPVIRMYLGELTSTQVFDLVGGKLWSPRGLCRFHLFYAELLLTQPGNDRRRETGSLQEAVKFCDPNDLNYQFARSELKRLGQ